MSISQQCGAKSWLLMKSNDAIPNLRFHISKEHGRNHGDGRFWKLSGGKALRHIMNDDVISNLKFHISKEHGRECLDGICSEQLMWIDCDSDGKYWKHEKYGMGSELAAFVSECHWSSRHALWNVVRP